jgi:hypothetical protein
MYIIKTQKVTERDVYDYNGKFYCTIEGTPKTFTDTIEVNGIICKWKDDKYVAIKPKGRIK